MSKMFHFERMINRYARYCSEITLISETEGTWAHGRHVPGEQTETQLKGVVVPFKQHAIYQSGGSITTKDRVLWTTAPIPTPFDNAHIVYNGNKYAITDHTDNGDFANAYRYVLKWTEALSDA